LKIIKITNFKKKKKIKKIKKTYKKGHKKPLISIVIDNTGTIVATGEKHKNPEIHLWDSRTATFLSKIKNVHREGVSSLVFSKNIEFLVTLGQDSLNSICVLFSTKKEWNDSNSISIFFSTSTSISKMLFILFVDSNEYPVVVGGVNSIYFFRNKYGSCECIRGFF
jgi:WD40 repeat protein